ncbi:UTP--glucose-1-phosphate uridylyltransferase [Luteococcus japonicus]|uniref:UTP--glucose-1-phosphate uridylyltransferase n=2 Tax=Luteococcus japonicus TaxID=33984 RepID=A0A1R4KB48_9ACTN|nr:MULTISPECIES: UTP--glucose-1-phosphate uridylyltransferase [Luteococcus]MDN5563959.1 UTP--glucose-1-phosphate uridylyltransferase [Luteococcus sp.]ROR54535.1 UTP--glucose-1-phosphate uridylyltransferase [Luteococcus japonicus]SJN41536.1 UTP--glucose-1-phosphate uridylyltransferase [Luteococcus japonicus LSP_Lj1]
MSAAGLEQAVAKMQAAGVMPAAIRTFQSQYAQLEAGAAGFIREETIEPMPRPVHLADLDVDPEAAREALDRTVVIKLNGGLGTSMGLDKAKNLLEVRDGKTFLDIIVQQVLAARAKHCARLPLMFMNSFRTHDDTLTALARYPELAVDGLPLGFLQNQEPKLRVDDLTPVEWPSNPSLEWCPPGHGDVYVALYGSGLLQQLIDLGHERLLLTNGDNLGASPDATMAGWFAASGASYAAELCRRTVNDRKGGHLAARRSDGQLILRDTAQTLPHEMHFFTDPDHHPYFHTNNLWLDLRVLHRVMSERDGVLGLPLIRNQKTVDPTDPDSTPVFQMESAMGAAIEVFEGATAICVGRERFLPVKTTNELLLLRSDLYELDEDGLLVAQAETPRVELDGHYKLVQDFSRLVPHPLGLRKATSLRVNGEVGFGRDVQVVGDVEVSPDEPRMIEDGTVLG